MDEHNAERLLAAAARRAAHRASARPADRAHALDLDRVARARPQRLQHPEGRDADALLERLRNGKGRREARG